MALKSKFRSLLRFGGSKEDKDEIGEDVLLTEAKEERRVNPMVVEEILEGIDKMYYKELSFDAADYTLQSVPEDSDVMQLDQSRIRLRQQLQAVSKKLSDLVLENHNAYVQELQRVTDIESSLQTTSTICSAGRRHLANARQGVTDGGISILAKHRKRQKILSVLQSLRTIKTLQQTDVRLREFLEEENYPAAVQLCLECQQAASTFKEYTCVSELSSKLQETQQQIEIELDDALAKNCLHFNVHHYEKVQTAFRLLEKTQHAMDQVHYHFTMAVHNRSFQVVLKYAERSAGNEDVHLPKLLYNDVCQRLDHNQFTPDLLNSAELCGRLC
ncbi:syndetin-like [Corticium candelabrum]|uniref:syndetin-like n=1 Tax=Corticium candelabrum TaxID=121492 RepID=UPI002E268A9A|nr:syndetin-like [Corticium candelabrum]